MNNNHLSNVSFDSLDLHAQIKAGICDAGFKFCTPIQAEALPITIDQKDVAGQAQTGTGKTAAFLIATFQRLLISNQKNTKNNKSQPMGFILAPTRELAIQIAKDADTLGKYTEIKVGLAYGGKDYEKQRKNIEKGIEPTDKVEVEIKYASGDIKKIKTLCRIDTKNEMEYYKNGGILQYVLRNMI